MLADLLFAGLFLTVGGILRVLGEGVFAYDKPSPIEA